MTNNIMKKSASQTQLDAVSELRGKNFNTSQIIKYLAAEGWERGDIARALGKRYQHVRNVLTQKAKKPTMREATAADIGIES